VKYPGRDSDDPVICRYLFLLAKLPADLQGKKNSIRHSLQPRPTAGQQLCSCWEAGPFLCNVDVSKHFTQLQWDEGTTLLGHMLSPYVYYQAYLLLLQFCESSVYSLAKPLMNKKIPVMIPFRIVTELK